MRKLDDKPLLVEIHLVESRLYYDLRNFPRSRAALTAARTAAGAIYCPPALQAAIDMQAGIINSQEKDFRTGFSYFVEAFDSFQNFDTPNAVLALKYMLLCKIMSSAAEEVGSLIDGSTLFLVLPLLHVSRNQQAKAGLNLPGLTLKLCVLWLLPTRNALSTISPQRCPNTARSSSPIPLFFLTLTHCTMAYWSRCLR